MGNVSIGMATLPQFLQQITRYMAHSSSFPASCLKLLGTDSPNADPSHRDILNGGGLGSVTEERYVKNEAAPWWYPTSMFKTSGYEKREQRMRTHITWIVVV